MASTNKTTNYELSQFIETDRPAWLTDYNGDMRTIDSTMKAISDVASGASGSISALADRMSTAEGNITTNTNDISTLDARADALEAGAQSQARTIANIQTEQTAQNLGIEAATELGYNLARPYDSASTYAVGDYVLFQNTLYKCITAVSTGEAFDPTKWLAIKATDEIAAGGGVTITALDNTNFALSVSSFNVVSVIQGTPYTPSTPDLRISSDVQSFIATEGNLNHIHAKLKLTFNDVVLSANDVVEITFTTNYPAVLGSISNDAEYSTPYPYGGTNNETFTNITLKTDNTINYKIIVHNNNNQLFNPSPLYMVLDFCYTTS